MRIVLFILIIVQVMPIWLKAQGPLSIDEIREIVGSPGDALPLRKELREARPFWREAEVVFTLSFPEGPSITEKVQIKLKTVKGRYAVFTMFSPSQDREVYSVLSYDDVGGLIVASAMYGDEVVSGVLMYDPRKGIYSGFSRYMRDGEFTEYCVGQYSESEMSDRTLVLRDGRLVMTRETKVIPLEK